jgi:hypothetical protein
MIMSQRYHGTWSTKRKSSWANHNKLPSNNIQHQTSISFRQSRVILTDIKKVHRFAQHFKYSTVVTICLKPSTSDWKNWDGFSLVTQSVRFFKFWKAKNIFERQGMPQPNRRIRRNLVVELHWCSMRNGFRSEHRWQSRIKIRYWSRNSSQAAQRMVIGVTIHLMFDIWNDLVSTWSYLQLYSNVINQSDSDSQKMMDTESQHSLEYRLIEMIKMKMHNIQFFSILNWIKIWSMNMTNEFWCLKTRQLSGIEEFKFGERQNLIRQTIDHQNNTNVNNYMTTGQ